MGIQRNEKLRSSLTFVTGSISFGSTIVQCPTLIPTTKVLQNFSGVFPWNGTVTDAYCTKFKQEQERYRGITERLHRISTWYSSEVERYWVISKQACILKGLKKIPNNLQSLATNQRMLMFGGCKVQNFLRRGSWLMLTCSTRLWNTSFG
jgi:hypothetical protein